MMQGETYDKNRIAFKFFDIVILQLLSDDQEGKMRSKKDGERAKANKME